MANAFWGITGFFIVLEVAFALAVLFSGGTKDDKQYVPSKPGLDHQKDLLPTILRILVLKKHYQALFRTCRDSVTEVQVEIPTDDPHRGLLLAVVRSLTLSSFS